ARADKQRQKSLDRIAKDREKKDKQRAKAKAKELNQYDDCDSTKIVRTSKDTAILVKYIRIYRTLGGACYILHLQRMAKLEKTADGFYSVQMKESSDPRAPADWQTYLYCPIGKPNGLVALTSPAGDTVQTCQYQDEKKNGDMIWYKKGKGAIHQEIYTNDVRQMNMLDTLMNH
ncbi:MAG TPA: hypothetical protein VFU15_05300, partial [Bacteroidia bacterium]|nr:hypothetical protein [Bacteroidia bacterium]